MNINEVTAKLTAAGMPYLGCKVLYAGFLGRNEATYAIRTRTFEARELRQWVRASGFTVVKVEERLVNGLNEALVLFN